MYISYNFCHANYDILLEKIWFEIIRRSGTSDTSINDKPPVGLERFLYHRIFKSITIEYELSIFE